MLFNSIPFLIFLPIVFILYWFVFNSSLRWQNTLLLVASYFFYGWWSWKFLGLLALSTLLDYLYGFGVASEKPGKSKFFLWLSVINNLGILALFKYYDFFALQFKAGFEALGWHANPLLLNWALPIGISFYTFHGMSYVFDIYRKKQAPVKNIVDYAVFVSFFPLLVAGPIERAHHLLPQVESRRFFNYTQAVEGCRLILWGFFKKVFIADSIAAIIDPMFSSYNQFNGVSLILVTVGFSFQIYCDFSGYSDVAIGTAKLFGFELLSNFKFPYFSRNIAEFWRRWHISLSSWFKDYLYIPLGGSKINTAVTIRNIMLIFLASGFWHGASWNFIGWGFIHACGFIPLLIVNANKKYAEDIVAVDRLLPTLKEFLQITITFCFVAFAWIFFRATDFSALDFIIHIGKNFFSTNDASLSQIQGKRIVVYCLILVIFDWWFRKNERKLKVPNNLILRNIIYLFFSIIVISSFLSTGHNKFIYFQF